MSEPPNTSTITPPNIVNVTPYPAISYKNHHLPAIIHGGATTSTVTLSPASNHLREYRKGNWTLEETLVLITAKKLDDERRINATTSATLNIRGGELRWKWVENYCWSHGCLRSQNQCNDKWDNLLRDYKKVREYEVRSPAQDRPSYWSMDKTQRKERNLPSNLLLNIYEALNDVVHRKIPHRQQQPLPPALPPPPPPPPPAAVTTHPPPPASEASAESSETEGEETEKVDSETKRRRVRDIGSSIVDSTTLLSQTLKSYEEKKEKRHRELMELEEQRLRLEETRNEMNRQGIVGLVASINKLSDAIHSLISEKRGKP
ncbi:trihelix transcription factor ASR3-like [Cynara cardunculus var. scolymus]|uniref:Myb-like domain-containing protein n=1 Tax=Cynara cardunculus var. scolymus TaxID=59895 RepID=A0A103XCI9_CYNCS|nr:trihelix transcription factor ASR3-like [Cynara cardunculus var. scolymus]KVH88215.1 Myb-like domain-containing protein [Cynara cardunculus var. scolymus]